MRGGRRRRRGRGRQKTTSKSGQAWSSPSPRGLWRTGNDGERWLVISGDPTIRTGYRESEVNWRTHVSRSSHQTTLQRVERGHTGHLEKNWGRWNNEGRVWNDLSWLIAQDRVGWRRCIGALRLQQEWREVGEWVHPCRLQTLIMIVAGSCRLSQRIMHPV